MGTGITDSLLTNQRTCPYEPFFIDYAFTNIQAFAYEIGKWDKTESDHCPQMIVF